VSFLTSRAGLYTYGALLSKQSEDEEKMKEYIEKLKGLENNCYLKERELGVLNGIAGYLHCLSLIKVNIPGY
jgi:SMC interacting uncharacterized protein involved in chromosome segregation